MKPKAPNRVYTLRDLHNWGDATGGVRPPIRLGVIGDPVEHSLSPQLQNAALRHCGLAMQYVRMRLTDQELEEGIRLMVENGFVGFNVTLPHKERVLSLVDQVDRDADQIGAVNTVVIRNGKQTGFNTDAIGFSRAIREQFSVDLRDLRVLLLGGGGAARAIAFECARQNCERLVVANRTRAKADGLIRRLQPFFAGPKVLGPVARLQATGWNESELAMQIPHTDLLVNATPLGLQHSDAPAVPARLLAPHLMIFDTVYRRERTPLLVAAAEAGARAANGASMLLHQGAGAFELWFARETPLSVMRGALDTAMA